MQLQEIRTVDWPNSLVGEGLAARPGDLNSVPGTDTVEVIPACCPMPFICLHACVHAYKLNEHICKVLECGTASF